MGTEKKKSGNGFGSASALSLPMMKVRGMMKSNDRVAAVSTEASLVMTKAAEHFIGWVTKKAIANKDLRERKKVCLNYHDLPPLVAQNPDQLEFAGDLLPFRRPKWEHLGLKPPKGVASGPSSATKAKKPSRAKTGAAIVSDGDKAKKPAVKRSKPKVEATGVDGERAEQTARKKKASRKSDAGDGVDVNQSPSEQVHDTEQSCAGKGIVKKPARKSDGAGGSSSKRRKKSSTNEKSGRCGSIEGLLDDDDEESADRRAVENLVEAACGNLGFSLAPGHQSPQKPVKSPKKSGSASSRSKNADKASGGASRSDGLDGGPSASGILLDSPERAGLAASLRNPGGLQLSQLPQLQLQDSHAALKRLEQQEPLSQRDVLQQQLQQRMQAQASAQRSALVAQTSQHLLRQAFVQAVQQSGHAAQHGQAGGPGAAASSQALQSALAGVFASASMFPGHQQNGSGGASLLEPVNQATIGGFPLGLAQLLTVPSLSLPQGFNTAQALAMLSAAASAQAQTNNAVLPNTAPILGSPSSSSMAPAAGSSASSALAAIAQDDANS